MGERMSGRVSFCEASEGVRPRLQFTFVLATDHGFACANALRGALFSRLMVASASYFVDCFATPFLDPFAISSIGAAGYSRERFFFQDVLVSGRTLGTHRAV